MSGQPPGILVVTGGSRGIGAAVVRLAAARGWAVAIGSHSRSPQADALAAEIRASGGQAVALAADVADSAAVDGLFAAAAQAFPDRRITGVVASAGLGGPTGLVADLGRPAALQELFAVNVLGVIHTARAAVRSMSTVHGGSGGGFVAVSSMAATIGGRPGKSVYAASKAAVDAFTVGLAKEVAAQGIRVNAVRPGVTRTDMTAGITGDPRRSAAVAATIPIGRFAEADEVAKPILWLLSEEASFVSGAVLDVSGGGFVLGAVASGPSLPATNTGPGAQISQPAPLRVAGSAH
ncbi:glucose-1-dehydrogenase [Planctomycetota bacterium]|nr:glucose-1-dehydrogenase [Planctomycetota bacterium]